MFTSLLLTVKHKLVFALDNRHLDCQKNMRSQTLFPPKEELGVRGVDKGQQEAKTDISLFSSQILKKGPVQEH